jgi:hypothetical protein
MNYVPSIEPRLTPHRPVAPGSALDALVEWLLDLEQEAVARLELITAEQCAWTPHPDANDPDVTFWHIARWLDVLAASRVVTEPNPTEQAWSRDGWVEHTGYDPTGIGYLGLGTLTGYSTEEMRAVPRLGSRALSTYLRTAVRDLTEVLRDLGAEEVNRDRGFGTPFQLLGSTIQGSFGHLGEIDSLVALHDRLDERSGTRP